MAGRIWNRQETLAAFALYCQLPFGRLNSSTPEIVALAQTLGRTTDAVVMKCCNLASLDATHRNRGVKGLARVATLARAVWREFEENPAALGYEAAQALAHFQAPEPPLPGSVEDVAPLVTDREATVR